MSLERKNIEKIIPILEEPDVKNFIKNAKIQPEDFKIIEKLATFPREFIILYAHNIFNLDREESVAGLKRSIENAKSEDEKNICELFLKMAEKYTWAICHGLVRILEEKKQEPGLYFKWGQIKKEQ